MPPHQKDKNEPTGPTGQSAENRLNPLKRRIDGEVHDDPVRRYMHATDASVYRVQPRAVVYPRNQADVVQTVRFAMENGYTVHPRGAGSGTCGAALGQGLVVDFSKFMNRLTRLDTDAATVTCQPGYRRGELEAALAGTDLFFPPDPSSGEFATFGGMVATNACGAHSVKYGNVVDYLIDAEVVLADGTCVCLSQIRATPKDQLPAPFKSILGLYNDHKEDIHAGYPDVRSNSCGYHLRDLWTQNGMDLRNLLAGAEGTLGIITSLTFQLRKKPAHDALVIAFFADIQTSAQAVQKILPMGPSGIEIMDGSVLELASRTDGQLKALLPEHVSNVLLVEFDGDTESFCRRQADAVQRLMTAMGAIEVHQAFSREEKDRFWAIRKAIVPILYRMAGKKKAVAVIEDAVVPAHQLVSYYKGIYHLLNARNIGFVIYGHISRGLLHVRPLLNLKDPEDVRQMAVIADAFFELVHGHGGTISGEHGDGRLRSQFINRQYPDLCHLMRRVKEALDPNGIFNPDIKTNWDPAALTSNLRYGENYHRREPSPPILNWPEGFAEQAESCHGCAKCTTVTHATRMCPVYKFTRDEAAAPRAKANVLRALISGAVDRQDLYQSAFQQVINACIGCGSCHAECPSQVNIPKLAMEAKARHVKKFGAPLGDRLTTSAEEMGRILGRMPQSLQKAAGLPTARKAIQALTGISADRPMIQVPKKSIAPLARPRKGIGQPRVLYFTGCYAAYIQPAIGRAAIQVLESMGMTVRVPPQHCCGVPTLSKGMTSGAGTKIRQNLDQWGALIDSVEHVVVTCSSCGLALGQEWPYLLQDRQVDALGKKLIHISALIARYPERLTLRPRPALVAAYHMPCHLKVQTDSHCSVNLLKTVPGLDLKVLSSHCCGMAGTWGMSAKNYPLSRTIGLDLKATMDAARADLAVTDCPTCRMQMEHFGALPVRHPVEIIARRIETGSAQSKPS